MKNYTIKTNRYVAYWLFLLSILIICMIAIGGYTRLTESGLSIVEWRPVTGVFYPVSEESWHQEFAKYKNSPEYQQINFDIDLAYFKKIYFTEYFHRLFGRALGFIFLLPLIYFSYKKYIARNNIAKFLGILFLGAIQGLIGWLMVKSGLVNEPRVSHFRLALHLIMAIIIFSLIFWQGLNYYYSSFNFKISFNNVPSFLILIAVIQIFYGGLVAGLDAGQVYNEFPFMGGLLIPEEIYSLTLKELLFYNPVSVQFIHRVIGIIFFALIIILLYKQRKHPQKFKSYLSLGLLVLIQICLGIATLLSNVQLDYALLHQIIAILIISNLLFLLHSLICSRSQP